jgi:dTDP-4-amino-4,6-dideoxygalactose transaminase
VGTRSFQTDRANSIVTCFLITSGNLENYFGQLGNQQRYADTTSFPLEYTHWKCHACVFRPADGGEVKSQIPFLRPRPSRLSQLLPELRAIEESGIFTNYGPVNDRFERALTNQIFGGLGGCLTVNCATTGLILAIREAAVIGRSYALMPSFTFAATAHAAIWAGLTPLFCDIDRETWSLSADCEERVLQSYDGQIACIVPYATFGNCIDLERYDRIAHKHGVGVVVDAAASLGSLDDNARGFGAGFPHAVVYSMHATKVFATAEGGVIHCGDDLDRLTRLRAMGNFGFGQPRCATMLGLNSKLSEIGALLALSKLDDFEKIVRHRNILARAYKDNLPGFIFQRAIGQRLSYQFMPTLLPTEWAGQRGVLVDRMAGLGVQIRHYFSPHLAEHPFFSKTCRISDLPVTEEIAGRIVSLPISDTMTVEQVQEICEALKYAMDTVR